MREFIRVLALSCCAALVACGSDSDSAVVAPQKDEWVLRWNDVAMNTTGIDHGGLGEQLGPTRASRAIAMVHWAMFEVANGFEREYRSALDAAPVAPDDASMKSALAKAAHDVLVHLYPGQATGLRNLLGADLTQEANEPSREAGIAFGAQVAQQVIAARIEDGSHIATAEADAAYPFSDLPGRWRMDPLNPNQLALGSLWSQVRPFVLAEIESFRAPPPPALSSPAYAAAFNEVARLGGDGFVTPTDRSADQTLTGLFWAYDGTPSLCAPPRLYNQIARSVGETAGLNGVVEWARYLALTNIAMADAGIVAWESKYFYDLWRPVTALREADIGTGPSGEGDGNALTTSIPNFTPLGAPASNLSVNDFTPPFPTYPSGHAVFGGALFQVLRRWFGTDDIAFEFVSDEYNGVTVGSDGAVRPLVVRQYANLSEPEEENGQSRIYLGIHFEFDKTAGIEQGNAVGNAVFDSVFLPQ